MKITNNVVEELEKMKKKKVGTIMQIVCQSSHRLPLTQVNLLLLNLVCPFLCPVLSCDEGDAVPFPQYCYNLGIQNPAEKRQHNL